MDDGFQCIGRLSFPVFRRYKTESEVATMKFIAERTSVRVPEVYAWDSDPDNIIGAEYILMEKMPGTPLKENWTNMTFDEKKHIVSQIIDIMLQLFNTTFDNIGSLYIAENGTAYEVGPVVCDLVFDGKRSNMGLDCGPWKSTEQYLMALILSETDYLKACQQSRDSGDGDDNDDDYDEDDVDEINRVCTMLEKIVPFFCPTSAALERFCIQHTDLHLGNIMIEGNEVSSIIDWESSGTHPVWQGIQYPDFLIGRGVSVKTNDANNWIDKEDYQRLLEETNLRIKDFPALTERWIKHLSNGSDGWDYDPMTAWK
ncbi:Phosphotransferase enzyme [Linnemannia zychae]|nr:Phosphotransferase enzyme [Linnemannia zychae]